MNKAVARHHAAPRECATRERAEVPECIAAAFARGREWTLSQLREMKTMPPEFREQVAHYLADYLARELVRRVDQELEVPLTIVHKVSMALWGRHINGGRIQDMDLEIGYYLDSNKARFSLHFPGTTVHHDAHEDEVRMWRKA